MSLFAFTTHFRLFSFNTLFTAPPEFQTSKSEQDCCQHRTIRAHLCHEISDQKKKNIERSNSPAVSSHPSSSPHGTANLLVNSIPLLTVCLLLLIARIKTERGYVIRRHHRTSFHINYTGWSKSICTPDDYDTRLSCLITWLNLTAWQPTARVRETLDSH
jgi:hypothetical protein